MPDKKNYRRHGSRYSARSHAVQILYEAELRDVDPVEVMEEHSQQAAEQGSLVKPVAAYTRQVIEGVAVELNHVDTVLAEHLSENWELDRLPALDRAVLRLSIWELLYNEDIPRPTAVVEGVELGFQYSGPQSSAYINGLLDRVAKNLDAIRQRLNTEESEEPETAAAEDTQPQLPENTE